MSKFQDLMHERGFSCNCQWSLRNPVPNTEIQRMECFLLTGPAESKVFGFVIVQEFKDGGWEVFTASTTNEISKTIDEVIDRLRKAEENA